jgi:hypothetical protein
MTPDIIINILGLIVLPIVGVILSIFLKMILALAKSNAELKEEIGKYKLHVAETYLNKTDFNGALEKLELNIQRIFEKLDLLAERRGQERRSDEKS